MCFPVETAFFTNFQSKKLKKRAIFGKVNTFKKGFKKNLVQLSLAYTVLEITSLLANLVDEKIIPSKSPGEASGESAGPKEGILGQINHFWSRKSEKIVKLCTFQSKLLFSPIFSQKS